MLVYPLSLAKGEVVEVAAVAVPPRQPGQQRVLVIQGIEYDPKAENKFDVAINVPGDQALQVGPENSEYAGSFAVVPSSKAGGGTLEGRITLFIDDVLDDVMGDGDTTVDVVLVPRTDEEIKVFLPPTIQNQ
jgi:polyphenol oxidase